MKTSNLTSKLTGEFCSEEQRTAMFPSQIERDMKTKAIQVRKGETLQFSINDCYKGGEMAQTFSSGQSDNIYQNLKSCLVIRYYRK